jgi:ABC-type transporter Mla subunit MlaD
MRHHRLRLQNRVVGILVALLAAWGLITAVEDMRARSAGAAYYSLTTDVTGVRAGSLVTLNGFEVGQVTGVALQHQGRPTQSAGELLFRVDFQVLAPVVFAAKHTYLRVEEVNPVAPARLVIEQRPGPPAPEDTQAAASAEPTAVRVIQPCPPRPADAGDLIPVGGCIPTQAAEEDMRPGLSGLIAAGTQALVTLERTVAEFGQLGREIRDSNQRVAAMLSDQPGSLYRLPGALEDAADRVAQVTEQLHLDMVERVDRMVTPETIASLARATAELEELIATTGHGSQETLENLAAITRGLNRITWELERDPIGFLRGAGGGTR